MIHIDDLSGYPFSASDLYSVCEKYAARLVKSAEAVELDFEPTETSRFIIRQLMDKSLRKSRRHSLYRHVAAVAAVIIILFSTVLATNVHAREAVVRWLRQVFPDFVLYQFFGESSAEVYHYTIGWMPEGFELIDHERIHKEEYYVYTNGERGIVIDFRETDRLDELILTGYSNYTLTDTTLNGFKAVIYQDNESSDMDIVVFDTDHGIAICINTNVDLLTVVNIINAIK